MIMCISNSLFYVSDDLESKVGHLKSDFQMIDQAASPNHTRTLEGGESHSDFKRKRPIMYIGRRRPLCTCQVCHPAGSLFSLIRLKVSVVLADRGTASRLPPFAFCAFAAAPDVAACQKLNPSVRAVVVPLPLPPLVVLGHVSVFALAQL